MSEKKTPPSLAQLLQHAAWARHLARGLVAADADDVVQDTWMAALRRPPDTARPTKPWLGTVVRNHAFNRSRERSRREARETRAETREVPESPEAVLGRLELHKRLVEAVSALPEPYRRAVLLAYFEELTSAEIAARENVAASTVRGRLKTALELLREALDAGFGGRATWLALVADLGRPPAAVPSATSVAARAGQASGGASAAGASALPAAMGVVVVVAATAVTLWSGVGRTSGSAPKLVAAADVEAPSSVDVSPAPASRRDDVPTESRTGAVPPSLPAVNASAPRPPSISPAPTGGTLLGQIGYAVPGTVVAGGPEAAAAGPRVGKLGGVSGAVVRIVGGLERLPAPPGRPLRIERGRFLSRVEIVPAGAPLVLHNDDAWPETVRVTRGGSTLFNESIPGKEEAIVPPVTGTEILRVSVGGGPDSLFLAPSETDFAAVTDGGGRFVLRGVPPGRYTLEVWDEALGTRTTSISAPAAEAALRIVFGSDPHPLLSERVAEPERIAAPARVAAPERIAAPERVAEPVALMSGTPCTIATEGDGPMARACASGGRKAATRVMKDLLKQAKALGEKWTCDGCHKDLDAYELTRNARDDLETLLAFLAQPKASP